MSSIPSQLDRVDRFCQYLWLTDSGLHWHTDNALKRNFLEYQHRNAEFADLCQNADDNAIALFWRDMAVFDRPIRQAWESPQRQQLALKHLSAFLEKDCYQTAESFFQRRQSYSTNMEFKLGALEDYWQYVQLEMHTPDRLIAPLQRYELERGTLKNYFKNSFFQGALQKFADDREAKFSRWRLLYKATKPKIKKALEKIESSDAQIACILFAWKQFHTSYSTKQLLVKAKGEKYPEPTSETYAETVLLYNSTKLYQDCRSAVANSPELTVEKLKQLLEQCIEALIIEQNRSTLNSSDSLDRQLVNTEGSPSTGRLIDILEYPEPTSDPEEKDEDDEELEEDLDYKSQIKKILNDTFPSVEDNVDRKLESGRFPRSYKSLPLMYYGFNIKQIPLEGYYGVNQSNLTRHLTKYYKRPLREAFDTKATSKKSCIQDWMTQWFGKKSSKSSIQKSIEDTLHRSTKSLSEEQQRIWELQTRQNYSPQQIAQELSTTAEDIAEQIQKIEAKLEKKVLDEIDRQYDKYILPYLKTRYRTRIENFLREAVEQQQSRNQTPSISSVDEQVALVNITDRHIKFADFMAMMEFRDALLTWIEETLYLHLDRSVEHLEIEQFIEQWLTENK